MNLHFVVIFLIIAVIVMIQLSFFKSTISKINEFLSIFPTKPMYSLKKDSLIKHLKGTNDEVLKKILESRGFYVLDYMFTDNTIDGDDSLTLNREKAIEDLELNIINNVEGIESQHNNVTFINIINSINAYMENNNSSNDYHLMKDIVDRNCDSKEEEINTQTPIPLYLGLVGTMAGILVGILFLWLSGGLSDLLNAESNTGSGASGIEALLGGVALAMISSILGIVLTTISSNKFKSAKIVFEEGKNKFYSWIQENLLPKLSDNVVGAIREMTDNLTRFNDTFSNNVKGLDYALAKVNESYRQQTDLLEVVNKIADKDLSMKNLQLFNALTKSAKEIEQLGEYLRFSNEYLDNVKSLNENLNTQENRTRIMEDVGIFFKNEAEQIDERRGLMSKAVGKIDDSLKQALDKIRENIDNEFIELQKITLKNQDVIKQKTQEIESIVNELHQLTDVKKSIDDLSNEMKTQNSRTDRLTQVLEDLTILMEKRKESEYPVSIDVRDKKTKKRWIKKVSIISISLVVVVITYFVFLILFSI